MGEKSKYKVNILLAGLILFGLFVCCLLKPETLRSETERRGLKTLPEVSADKIFNKKGGSSFMDDFEVYAKDQFPFRETFRSINAVAGRYLLGRAEVNGLYVSDGYIARLEDGISEKDLEWSLACIGNVLDRYGADCRSYMALIPDKNYYLAPEAGYPYVDAAAFEARLYERLGDRVTFLRLWDRLEKEDYYRTDTHWRQEKIADAADFLLKGQGRESRAAYRTETLSCDFYGVYYGQAALPVAPEELRCLTWEGMERLAVTDYETGMAQETELYDLGKAEGSDPYEVFLSGPRSLIRIDNPDAPDGHLVIFRDSFGSSMAPLLVPGYRTVTLVDIRYLNPNMVGRFVDFTDADILFLYSTTILNSSVGQLLK